MLRSRVFELGELADGGRYLTRQAREAQTQRAQVGQLIELGRDGTRELAVVLQLERAQSGELSDALRQGATELVAAEVRAVTRGAPATSLTWTPAQVATGRELFQLLECDQFIPSRLL